MTDDRMDARLQAAGARWRDGHVDPAPAAVDETVPADLTSPRPRRSRIGLWASVLAVAAVFLADGVVTLAGFGGDGGAPARRGITSAHSAPASLAGSWALARVVRSSGTSGGSSSGSGDTNLGYRILFTGGAWAVIEGCALGGTFTVQGQTLSLRDLSSVSCALTDQPAISQPFFDVISGSAPVQWKVDGSTLTLTHAGTALSFQKVRTGGAHSGAHVDLLAGSWRLLSAETNIAGSSTGSGSSDSPYRLQFSGGGYLITAGCPTSGTFAGDDTHLKLTLNDAQDACGGAGPPSQIDKLVQATLKTNGSVGWNIAGSTLTLTRGDATLTFIRTK